MSVAGLSRPASRQPAQLKASYCYAAEKRWYQSTQACWQVDYLTAKRTLVI